MTKARTPDIAVSAKFPEGADIKLASRGGIEIGKLDLQFKDGRFLELDANKLSNEILSQAIMHGLKQKLVDAAAITRDPETGRSATIQTKYDAIEAIIARLMGGEWNKNRSGVPTGGLLKRALVQMYAGRKTAEQIEAFLAGKSDKEKTALRKNPQVAEIIESLRAADAKDSGEELPDLLAELDGGGETEADPAE